MATKATAHTARRQQQRRRMARREAGGLRVADVAAVDLLRALCAQLPAPADAGESGVWNWVYLVDCGVATVGEMEERHRELAQSAAWKRLTVPAAVAGRARVRRRVDAALEKISVNEVKNEDGTV